MRRLVVAVMLALACGGDEAASSGRFEYPQPNPTPPSELQRQPQQATTRPTGVVHDVRMQQGAEGRFAFEPATIMIRDGDLVRWVVANGTPHNVAFYPESIPPGAARFLTSAIPADGRISPLGGRILVQDGATFEILFAGAPAGSYRYFCVPHEFAGMKGTIVVRAR